MPDENIVLMDGRLHVYRRPRSRYWQCSTYLLGRNHRISTKEESAPLAKDFARDWYMEMHTAAKRRQRGEMVGQPNPLYSGHPDVLDRRRRPVGSGPTFKQAADAFMAEYIGSVAADRSAHYVAHKQLILRVHIMPFFGKMTISEVTSGTIQDYRVHRQTSRKDKAGKPVAPTKSTLHKEIVLLNQIAKTAHRKGWISSLPDLSTPYKTAGKVGHRAWFSPAEYKQLYTATAERAKNPPSPRWRGRCELLHDYVLFMANTGLRPDEASRLEFRDIETVTDDDTGQEILLISVRGKRGVGYCKSTEKAVHPFRRLSARAAQATQAGPDSPPPKDLVFGEVQRDLLNKVLEEIGLKHDREGTVRTAYSLRHSYISFRLSEGADIYQLAKNCRTSVEMIEKHYARHIQTSVNVGQINVTKSKKKTQKKVSS